MTFTKHIFLSTAAVVTMFATSAKAAEQTVAYLPTHYNDSHVVTYVTGGVGDQDQRVLSSTSEAYNLKVTSAYNTGHYLSDVAVMVTDQKGNIVINTVTDGPMLYADLEPGTYNVIAMYEDKVNRKQISIGKSTNLREIVFYWAPKEPVNG